MTEIKPEDIEALIAFLEADVRLSFVSSENTPLSETHQTVLATARLSTARSMAAKILELEAALKPFADEAEGFAPAWLDRPDPNASSSPWYTLENPPGFTIADLRRARAALNAGAKE